MKPKKERSPWLWLLLIPIQLVVAVLLFIAGALLDAGLFSGAEGQGHGMPVFSLLLTILAAAGTVIAILVALIGLTVSLIRRSKRRRRAAENQLDNMG